MVRSQVKSVLIISECAVHFEDQMIQTALEAIVGRRVGKAVEAIGLIGQKRKPIDVMLNNIAVTIMALLCCFYGNRKSLFKALSAKKEALISAKNRESAELFHAIITGLFEGLAHLHPTLDKQHFEQVLFDVLQFIPLAKKRIDAEEHFSSKMSERLKAALRVYNGTKGLKRHFGLEVISRSTLLSEQDLAINEFLNTLAVATFESLSGTDRVRSLALLAESDIDKP